MTRKREPAAPKPSGEGGQDMPDPEHFRQECRRNTGDSRTVGRPEPKPEEEALTDE